MSHSSSGVAARSSTPNHCRARQRAMAQRVATAVRRKVHSAPVRIAWRAACRSHTADSTQRSYVLRRAATPTPTYCTLACWNAEQLPSTQTGQAWPPRPPFFYVAAGQALTALRPPSTRPCRPKCNAHKTARWHAAGSAARCSAAAALPGPGRLGSAAARGAGRPACICAWEGKPFTGGQGLAC